MSSQINELAAAVATLDQAVTTLVGSLVQQPPPSSFPPRTILSRPAAFPQATPGGVIQKSSRESQPTRRQYPWDPNFNLSQGYLIHDRSNHSHPHPTSHECNSERSWQVGSPRRGYQSPPPHLPTRAEEHVHFDVPTYDEPPRRFRPSPMSHERAKESPNEIQAMKAQLKYLRRQARLLSGVETAREFPSQRNSCPPPPYSFQSSNYRSCPPPPHSTRSQYPSSVPQRPRHPMIPIRVTPKSSDDEVLDQFSNKSHSQDPWFTDESFDPWFHTGTQESFAMSSDVSSDGMSPEELKLKAQVDDYLFSEDAQSQNIDFEDPEDAMPSPQPP